MTLDEELQQIPDVDLVMEMVDGKLSMNVHTNATLRVKEPEHTPLSKVEPHLGLYVVTGETTVRLELDAVALDALADAIHHAQEGTDD